MVMIDNEQLYHQPSILKKLIEVANATIPENEVLLLALKGTFKEFLFCTDRNVYIIKQGYMTGHTFGLGMFSMAYNNITNVEIDMKLFGGYFEISGSGIQNTDKSYWSNDKKTDPAKQPNTISLGNKSYLEAFNYAKNFILQKSNEANNNSKLDSVSSSYQVSIADEILKFKNLLDMGAITQEEFENKKKELLER